MSNKKAVKKRIINYPAYSFISSAIFLLIVLFFLVLSSAILFSMPVYAEQFNIEVKIPETYKTTTPGTEVWFTINVLNLGNTNRIDVVLNSEIVDEEGVIQVSKTKTVAMETTASFVNSLSLPVDLPDGTYYVVVSITFPDRTVESREQFTVKAPDNKLFWIIIMGVIVIFIILLIILLVRFYKTNIDKLMLRIRIKQIIDKRFKK
jgi:hypothetical protein